MFNGVVVDNNDHIHNGNSRVHIQYDNKNDKYMDDKYMSICFIEGMHPYDDNNHKLLTHPFVNSGVQTISKLAFSSPHNNHVQNP